ncbi:MAG: aminofutalosine synthase MqnE [Desulfovibrionaceae bacterium]
MPHMQQFERHGLGGTAEKLAAGERIDRGDALRLLECPDPTLPGRLAHDLRTRLHGDATFYVINRHVNYTNICVNGCAFCAYSRTEGQPGAFELTVEEAARKAQDSPLPPQEIHVVGGCHPSLGLSYYVDMLKALREAAPGAALKCFTAEEIRHVAALEGITTREVLQTLKDAGLAMLPGGGAEIFAPEVRSRICPRKITGTEWLAVHHQAHKLGLPTNCTMLFGHLESHQDRVDHLFRLRELQDETGGFTCFIPLPFLIENSALKVKAPLTGVEELKTIAVSRLVLDNIPHVKAYWIMLSVKQAQAALHFGADDLDGVVVEEKIGHMAGAEPETALSRDELTAMIRDSGFRPVERDAFFNPVQEDAP